MADEFKTVLRIEADAGGAAAEIQRVRAEHAALAAQVQSDNSKMSGANAEYAQRVSAGSKAALADRFALADTEPEAERSRRLADQLDAMSRIEATGKAPNRIRQFMDRAADIGRMSVGSMFGGGDADKAAASAEKLGRATDGAGESASRARPKLGALANAASLIAPEFGGVIALAHTLRDALMALATGPGAIIGAIAVAVGLLVVAFNRATAAVAEFRAESERLRQGGMERERDVGKSLANAGVPLKMTDRAGNSVSTVGRASARVRTLEDAGFLREEATPLAPFLAIPEGQPGSITDEEAKLIAAARQMHGAPELGTSPRQGMEQRITPMRRFMNQNRESAQAGVDQIQAIQARHLQAAAEGNEAEIAVELQRRYGYSASKAAKEAEALRKEIKAPKPRGLTWEPPSVSDALEGGGEVRVADQGLPITSDLKKRAAAAADAMELAERRAPGPATNVPLPAPPPQRSSVSRESTPKPPPGPVASAGTVIQNYGTVNLNPGSGLFAKSPRMLFV